MDSVCDMTSARAPLLLIAAALFLAAGCSGMRTAGEQAEETVAADAFERAVDPFPVYDTTGTRFGYPFLGGFNNPRPQFLDIDGDGDSDLFVQENTNRLMFFENTSSGGSPELEWRSDRFRDLEIGEWYRFVDMDQDGDFDLIAEQPYSYIRYYRNDGTPGDPDFTLVADSLKDAGGTPIFSDRQNIPNVTDIDCDGRLDLFIGRLDGTVMRYASTGRDDRGVPRFELVNKKFQGIEIVNQFGTLHGANTMTFVDIDSDGDQDLFWGDFFEPGLLLIENEGSCSSPEMQGDPTLFPPSQPVESSGYNAPAFADWDGDGDHDLFVGVLGGAYNASRTLAENFHYYERTEGGTYEQRTSRFLDGVDIGNESIPAAGDLDGDGRVELLLASKIDPAGGNSSRVYPFENRGEADGPAFYMNGAMDLPDAYHYAPALGDLDGDGREDLLLGTWGGEIAYYRNTGDGFASVSDTYLELERGSNSAPVLGDIDGDGDLDLFVGSSGGEVHFYRNEGSGEEPEFVLEEDAFAGVEAEHRSVPELYDIDGDGDLDLFVGTRSEGILFYRNTGSAGQPEFSREPLPFSMNAPVLAAPRFADLDGDGEAEFLSGGAGGGIIYYERAGGEE